MPPDDLKAKLNEVLTSIGQMHAIEGRVIVEIVAILHRYADAKAELLAAFGHLLNRDATQSGSVPSPEKIVSAQAEVDREYQRMTGRRPH